jgi:hypothetical protein
MVEKNLNQQKMVRYVEVNVLEKKNPLFRDFTVAEIRFFCL